MPRRTLINAGADIADEIFEDANGTPDKPLLPELEPAYHTVVEAFFPETFDLMEEYEEIERSLKITESLTQGVLQDAANQAEHMALRAYQLCRYAKIDIEAHNAKIETVHAALRAAATMKLEEMKAKKIRTKAITDADVVAVMAQYWPDEWQAAMLQRAQLHGVQRMFERLADLAKSRCKSLGGMSFARDPF